MPWPQLQLSSKGHIQAQYRTSFVGRGTPARLAGADFCISSAVFSFGALKSNKPPPSHSPNWEQKNENGLRWERSFEAGELLRTKLECPATGTPHHPHYSQDCRSSGALGTTVAVARDPVTGPSVPNLTSPKNQDIKLSNSPDASVFLFCGMYTHL